MLQVVRVRQPIRSEIISTAFDAKIYVDQLLERSRKKKNVSKV